MNASVDRQAAARKDDNPSHIYFKNPFLKRNYHVASNNGETKVVFAFTVAKQLHL